MTGEDVILATPTDLKNASKVCNQDPAFVAIAFMETAA
jgi:hypothetical protein